MQKNNVPISNNILMHVCIAECYNMQGFVTITIYINTLSYTLSINDLLLNIHSNVSLSIKVMLIQYNYVRNNTNTALATAST